MTDETPKPKPDQVDAATLARCDGPRRQLVFWSAVLLFIDLAEVNLSVPSTLELEGYASLFQLIENPRVIPACLSLVIMYFGFRLFVEWHQIPPEARQGRINQADIYVAVALGCLSLLVLVASNAGGADVGNLRLVPLTTLVTVPLAFALVFAFVFSAFNTTFTKVRTSLALIAIGLLFVASALLLLPPVQHQDERASRVDAATLFADLDALLNETEPSPQDVARGQRWRKRIAAFSPNDNQLSGIADRFAEIAGKPRTSSDVLLVLAIDADQKVRIATAANQNTPDGTLNMLAKDAVPEVRAKVAENQRTPESTLTHLAGDAVPEVRAKVAENQRTPESTLTHLAGDAVPEVRAKVAENQRTPESTLTELAGDAVPEVRAKVAENQRTPESTLTHLAGDAVPEVRAKVAENQRTPESTLTELAGDAVPEVRAKVAENQRTPESTLTELAKNDVVNVQVAVARNPCMPAVVLQELLAKKDACVDNALSSNASVPEALCAMAKDSDPKVRATAAAHPATPQSALMILAGDDVVDVQVAVAKNSELRNGPYKVLDKELSEKSILCSRMAYQKDLNDSVIVLLKRHCTTRPDL